MKRKKNNSWIKCKLGLVLLIIAYCMVLPNCKRDPLPVFPGAEGYGTETPAGRGGQIIHVTNLNADGPGSLRAACEASGPRIVVFDVSGTIDLTGQQWIYVRNPYITIAGQTAPSPGIQLRGAGIRVKTHDVLIQHIAVRPGNEHPNIPTADSRDCISIRDGYNIVIDHVSLSWSTDENIDTGNEPVSPNNITISNSIISEGLYNSGIRADGEMHSKGIKIDPDTKNISVIKNLLAHNHARNPLQQGGISSVILNNLVYNVGAHQFMPVVIGYDSPTNSPTISSFIGNVMIKGQDTTASRGIAVFGEMVAGSKLHVVDNSLYDIDKTKIKDMDFVSNFPEATSEKSPMDICDMTILPSEKVESYVKSHAGTRPAERNAVDTRIINDVTNGKGRIIDNPSQVGGWPYYEQNHVIFDPGVDPHGDEDNDGYTNIEEKLHWLAIKVETGYP